MIGYQSALLGRTEVAESTMAFQFEKPKGFVFKAGQYIDLALSGSHPRSSSVLTHTFSIASSPFDEEILYRDAHLLVVDKPHFLPVTPVGKYVQQSLLVRLKRKLGLEQLAPLHRIDRETAGIPVIVCSGAIKELKEIEGYLMQKNVGVLYKPFDIDELLRLVEKKLNEEQELED